MQFSLATVKEKLLKENRFKIVFFGDSITSTEWVHPNWREIIEYVLKGELEKQIGDWKISSWRITCINSGLDGATTDDYLAHLDSHVINFQPQLLIWIVGSNDQLYKFGGKKHQVNVQKIVDILAPKMDYLIVCSDSTRLNDKANHIYENEYLKTLAQVSFPKNAIFVDLFRKYKQLDLKRFFTFISGGNEVAGMKPGDIDFAHPNQLGNAYIAKIILEEAFQVKFDPEKYIQTTLSGHMYPSY